MDAPESIYPAVRSSIERHQHCFQFGVIMNKATLFLYERKFLFLLGKYGGVGLLGCRIGLCLLV